MKTTKANHTPNKTRTALIGTACLTVMLFMPNYVSPADAVMIAGAIGDDGSGPPGAFDGSITVTANTFEGGGGRLPAMAIDGRGIVLPGGDATDPNNYEHDAGDENGDGFNYLSESGDITSGWFKVDLGQIYSLSNAFFFNFNPDSLAGNESRGLATANIWYVDSDTDPGDNNPGDGAFNSTGWTQLGGVHNFSIAPAGDVNQSVPDVIDFGGVSAQLVALEFLTNHGHASFVGIGEIQFFAVPVPDPEITLVVVSNTLGATFDSVSNATYRLQSTPDLVSSNFTDTGAIVIGNGAAMTLFDPTGPSPSKNYRVEVD
jgi:hypothetical protein